MPISANSNAIEGEAASKTLPKPGELLLSPLIPAVVGKDINLYFDNLIQGEATRYDFAVHCKIGRHQNERWTCVPAEAGDYLLKIEVYSEDGSEVSAAKTLVRVKEANAGAGSARTVLFLGDSTTANGAYTGELLRLFALDPVELTLLGTQGAAPNVHEGRGGWRVDGYFEKAESPFVFDGMFDFARYMRENGFEGRGLTDLCVHLGINDVYPVKDDAGMEQLLEREMPMLEAMFASVRAYNPSIRIGVMVVIPPSRHQDSFGASYGTAQSRRRYKRNVFLWNAELLRRFGSREGFELIPINVNLDTWNNMPGELVPANSRSSRMVWRQNNGVHPSPDGYRQMADMIYYWLK